jgi:tetratricopeptide (TPR) repeat protein
LLVGLMARTGFAADPAPPAADALPPGGSERVVQLNEEGSALYAAGDYRRAAERFLRAHAVDEDPNLLFNIASCYEALGDIDAALEKYRAFLAAPNADPEGRPRAEQAIARLSAPASPDPVEQLSPPAVPAPSPVALPQGPADARAVDVGWVPWAGLGGGVVLGALGATFYWMGAANHSQVADTPGFDDPDSVARITRGRADDLVHSGDTKKALGLAAASAGAALIVGSVVWWLVDPSPVDRVQSSSSAAGFELTLNPSERAVHFSTAF